MTTSLAPPSYQSAGDSVRIVVKPDRTLYNNAWAQARLTSSDELEAVIEAMEYDLLDPETDELARFTSGEVSRAYKAERDRRERIRRLHTGNATIHDTRIEAWRALARVVRDRVPVPTVLRWAGFHVFPVGTNAKRGAAEYHSACPVCGGRDRLVSWDGPNSRCWCRQCGWKADTITATRSLIPGNSGFRDALVFLAGMAGVPQPGGTDGH